MKKFDIITEADARVLERGTLVELARGGHITPLARDTLRERRITVTEEGRASADDLSLAPRADIRSLAIGSDRSGAGLRRALVTFLRGRGLAVQDLGPDGPDLAGCSPDYADVAADVAHRVARAEADAGIVVDGTGIGSAIAANKISGIRASMAVSETIARESRERAGANVLTLGAILVSVDEAKAIVIAWLTGSMHDPACIRSLAKVRELDAKRSVTGGGTPE
jgi:ribose 5-phosphate isomerase B